MARDDRAPLRIALRSEAANRANVAYIRDGLILQKRIASLPSLGFSHPNLRQFIQHRLVGLLVHRCKTFVREG
jgi:hypothetical protein